MKLFPAFRRVFFWLHLVAGIAVGAIILVMASTGVLLSFERQITEAFQPYHLTPPAGGARLGPEALVAALQAAEPGPAPTALTLDADPAAPAAFQFGREKTLYVDPYTGAVLGEGAKNVRGFFQFVTGVHRWLALQGAAKDKGQAVTSAAALVFFFIILSGLVLWIPKRWTRRGVKVISTFQRRLKGRARDWNWHNVFGIWFALPLLVISSTGLVIAYPWANALLFGLAGEKPPVQGQGARGGAQAQAQGGKPAGGEAGGRGGPEGRREGGGPREGGGGRPGAAPAVWPASTQGWDAAVAAAQQVQPGWRTTQWSFPPGGEITINVSDSHRGRPDRKQAVTVDLATTEVRKVEGFAQQSRGRQWRTAVRWLHTGELGGWAGQLLAGLSAFAAVMLVWTGFALSWRRFSHWRKAKKAAQGS